jgi:hypothetical protein
MVPFSFLRSLNLLLLGLRNVMDELASHSVWAVAIGTKLLAKFCFVEDGHIRLDHQVGSSMGKGALITEFAFSGKTPLLAQFCAELVDIGSGWCELIVNG